MEYLLMAMEDERAFEAREDPELRDVYWQSWNAYIAALTDAGILRGAGGLEPPFTATTVRVLDGAPVVQDGPFAETKEQLGGYFVIDVADLDAALAWAARCPSADGGSCELRPLLPPRP